MISQLAVALIQGVIEDIQLLHRQAKKPRGQASWFYWFHWFSRDLQKVFTFGPIPVTAPLPYASSLLRQFSKILHPDPARLLQQQSSQESENR